jgi:hypothetical protein
MVPGLGHSLLIGQNGYGTVQGTPSVINTPAGFVLNTDRNSQKDTSMITATNTTKGTTTKLDKLCEKFLKEKQGTPAFRDTFFDKELFLGIKSGCNYQQLCEQLLTYVLHSSNKTPEDGATK